MAFRVAWEPLRVESGGEEETCNQDPVVLAWLSYRQCVHECQECVVRP